jgi:CBS domain containing-hemolysin-like protein
MLTNEEISISLVAVILLLAANAFFVAAEFALVKARGFRIENLPGGGGVSAKLTLKIQAELEAYLAACQLGITMASLGLGWVGEPAVAALIEPLIGPLELGEQALHTISFLLGFTIFSSLHIVVGEQVPKTFAIREPEALSLFCAIPLRVFFVVSYPLHWTLNLASRSLLSLFGVAEATHGDVLTNIEFRGLVSTSAEHGELRHDTAEMIQNLFRFNERTVGHVMIPRMKCDLLRLDQPPETNLAMMKDTRHSRFPVVDGSGDKLVGMILMKDIVDDLLSGNSAPWQSLRDHVRDALVVTESLKVSGLFDMMRAEKAHMACIADEYGTFVGLVTIEDLLEEIVGEIADETDENVSEFPIVETTTGWTAHGLASLADVERETGFFPAEPVNVNTLSGLFMHRLERIPVAGDSIIDGGYQFTVDAMKDHHVETVIITRT